LGEEMDEIRFELSGHSTVEIDTIWEEVLLPPHGIGIEINRVGGTLIIKGTPTEAGTFHYRILARDRSEHCKTIGATEVTGTIVVHPEPVPGVFYEGKAEVCFGNYKEIRTYIQSHGGDFANATFQWQESQNGTNFTDIEGQQSLTFTPDNLYPVGTVRYYRKIFRAGCKEDFMSNIVRFEVYDLPAPPTYIDIEPNESCDGTNNTGSITIVERVGHTYAMGYLHTNPTFGTIRTFDSLAHGYHHIHIKDSRECINSSIVYVPADAGIPSGNLNVLPGDRICRNQTGNLTLTLNLDPANAGTNPTIVWYQGLVAPANLIDGETTTTLTRAITGLPNQDSVTFIGRVTNIGTGCHNDFIRTIRIHAPTTITTPPIGADICIEGQGGHELNVVASSGLTRIYQWQSRPVGSETWTTISQNNPRHSVTTVVISDNYYRVMVSVTDNICPPIPSDPVRVTVHARPAPPTVTDSTRCGTGFGSVPLRAESPGNQIR
jgi:hypothetical protein